MGVGAVLLPRNREAGAPEQLVQPVQRDRPDGVGGGHGRAFVLGERLPLLEGEGEPPGGCQRRADIAQQGVLVAEGEHRLEKKDHVEGAGWDGWDAADLVVAGQVASVGPGRGDGGGAGVDAEQVAA